METRDRPERKRDPADVTVARPTFLLPHDLPAVLAALTDEQMERLRTAVDTEVRRRAGDQPNTPAPVTPDAGRRAALRPERSDGATVSPAIVNAIRAAFEAGVKPTMIARQLGVTPAVIRRVLTPGDR